MTVEELREKLQGLIGDVVRQLHADAYGDFDATIPPVIDSLIVAAHAEGVAEALEEDDYAIERVALVIAYEKGKAKGVAEGAEQMKEKIRDSSGFLSKGNDAANDDCFDVRMQRESGGFDTIAVCDCYVLPASVLAPTKEPYAERLRDSVSDIINGEDVDPTPD